MDVLVDAGFAAKVTAAVSFLFVTVIPIRLCSETWADDDTLWKVLLIIY